MSIKEQIKNTPFLLMFYGILESFYKTCLKETKNEAEAKEDIRAFVETILDEL